MAGEELLHGGLFEVALLGDEPIQPAQQRIHIAQCRGDGALLCWRWKRNLYFLNQSCVEVWLAISGSDDFSEIVRACIDVI